jgi:NADH:ubiquinone oxidoreductase subunit
MKAFLTRVFTWWNGETLGTQFWTWLHGEFVGEDEFGNRYYRTKGGKIDPTLGFQRRWVIYNGIAEASSIPPSWHGWMHHTVDVPPTEEKVQPRPWWKPPRARSRRAGTTRPPPRASPSPRRRPASRRAR